jgi:hypothetical protein
MRVDLYTREQLVAMLDTDMGKLKACGHFIPRWRVASRWGSKPPDRCTGSGPGRPRKIRKADARKQKRDRDARSRLELLAEDCFPSIWMPSTMDGPNRERD